jgi:ABC-2 type transport system ATP-binding protein
MNVLEAEIPAASVDLQRLLTIEDVRKTVPVGFLRRKVEILRGVTLTVRDGEVVGLLGPNGAGKTTTLKHVLGLMKPSSGRFELAVAKDEIGYLPENPYFYDYLTGREFLHLCARLFGLPARERRERADELLRDVGLERAARTQLRKYSKGMLQRIGIAQALINDPSFVLLDEPMNGLDPVGRVEVKRIIQRLHDAGKTILFNSHILADVEELCTHIAIMREGRVVYEGSVARALAGGAADLEAFFMEVMAS